MYTIQLTRGSAWDAPVLATHSIQSARHIVDVERLACSLVVTAPRGSTPNPTDYRILNHLGNCIRSSNSADVATGRKARAGRTVWGIAR